MRKLICILSLLAFLLGLTPNLAHSAAATITTLRRCALMNYACVTGTVTVNSGDTITTGLFDIIYFSAEINVPLVSGVVPVAISWTASGGVVTVFTPTNGVTLRFLAIGGP